MRVIILGLCASIAILLSGCGAGSPAAPNSPTNYPDLAGNWSLTATSQITSQNYIMGGYITNNNGSVTGTIHLLNSSCYALVQDIPLTGTISATGAVALTSAVVSSQTLTIGGTATSSAFSAGTYSISGGCGNGDRGTVTGYNADTYGHVYMGSFFSVSHITIGTTITAGQSGPDADGFFHVTGSATFSGSPCFTSGTISASTVAGSYMSVTITTTNGTVNFIGYQTDSTGKTISGNYTVTGGTCGGDHGTGSITHP